MSGNLGNVNLTLGLNTSPATAALRKYYAELNAGARKAAGANKPLEQSLEAVIADAKKLGATWDAVSQRFKKGGKYRSLEQLKQQIREVKEEFGDIPEGFAGADTAIQGFANGFKSVIAGIPQGIGLAIGQQLLAPLTNFGSTLRGAVGGAVETFVGIDRALRQTASISGATEAEFKELQNAVIDLARDTKFTTGELAETSTALARAGFTATEVQQALPGIADGAAAAGSAMDQMADVVIAALGGFQKSTEETAEVVDVLTAAANNSNTTVSELGEGLKYVGPIANSLGLSFEDVAAAAALLANQGIKASQMGTALRGGLTRLAAAADGSNSEFAKLGRGAGRMASVIQKLGVDIKDTNGSLKPMPQLLGALKGGFDQLDSTEKALAARILFGDEAGTAWISLLNQNIEEIERFANITNNASGTAAETSEKNLSGIAGSLKKMASAFDSASGKVGEFLATFLKPLIDATTAVVNTFNGLPDSIQKTIIAFTLLGGAITTAGIAYAGFIALKKTEFFIDMAKGVADASLAFSNFATLLKGKVVAAYTTTIAKAKILNATIASTNVATAASAMFTKIATGVKSVGSAIAAVNVKTFFAGIASGAAKATAAIKAFFVAAAPLGWTAAAIGAVALAWDTYGQATKGAAEVTDDTKDTLKELNDELKKIGKGADETNEAWERSVKRVGRVQAVTDKLRSSLNLTTTEQAQLIQTTIAMGDKYGKVLGAVDALAASFRDEVDALSGLEKGTDEYNKQVETLALRQEAVQKAIKKSVTELNAKRQALLDGRTSVNELTQEERKQIQAIDDLIKEFNSVKTEIEGFASSAKDASGATVQLSDSMTELKETTKEALESAKDVFNKELKGMEESFKNFKKELSTGLKEETDKIKDDIDGVKEAARIFTEIKQDEIRSIKEIADADKQATGDIIENNRRITETKTEALQEGLELYRQESEAAISSLERQKDATQELYDQKVDSSTQAHDRAMSQFDAELRAIQKQKDAISDRYDAALDGLRALTPAEQQLANLEKAKLQSQARQGGEDGLRARAQLERMQREEQIAQVEKQKAAEIEKLEAEAEAKREQKRQAEEAFQEKLRAIKLAAAEAEKKAAEEILEAKEEAATTEKGILDTIKEIKKENAEEEQRLIDEQEERARAAATEIKRREDDIRTKKRETAEITRKLEEQLDVVRDAFDKKRNAAEEAYNIRRNQLIREYRTTIDEAHNDIIKTGDTAWQTYATNAKRHLAEVAAAVAAADSAAANSTGADVAKGKWTGGPVSAGQIYTVNELGKEAFLSSTGKLSMIDAPAYGRWKAPSKGTVINAAQTEKLGLPGIIDAAASGIPLNAGGSTIAQRANSSATQNLLRAIAKSTSGDNIVNNVTIEAANTTQAASDVMVDLTKIKRRRIR